MVNTVTATEQTLFNLPGETSQIVLHYLRQQCISRGCRTLNQLQRLVRIVGRAKSVLELFLLRLDKQGLDISSPWEHSEEDSIIETLWPRLYRAWLEKEQCRYNRPVAERLRKKCN